MVAESKWLDVSDGRDRFALTREQLLEDYAEISSRRRGAAVATARRLRANSYLDILAYEASDSAADWTALEARLLKLHIQGGKRSLVAEIEPTGNADVFGEIAYYLLIENTADSPSNAFAVDLLEAAIDLLPKNLSTRKWRLMLVQSLILGGRASTAVQYLNRWKDINRIGHGYLRAELLNPFTSFSRSSDSSEWMRSFNEIFTCADVSPVSLEVGDGAPFDRLACEVSSKAVSQSDDSNQPLVSVIITSYQPTRNEIFTAVRSILRQTLTSIEVIVVDDASGPEYSEIFADLQEVDDRVSVHTMDRNQGTYGCRNYGVRVAKGRFFTGQDDDDWSHPSRLETQVQYLFDNPDSPGCRVNAVLCDENLSQLRLGYKPENSNASSLMMPMNLIRKLGGFMEARKAADTELVHRAQAYTGEKIHQIEKPLTIVRVLPDSLSRADFGAGWSHPSRDHFKGAYSHWHAKASKTELEIKPDALPPVAVPSRLGSSSSSSEQFDVIFAGDWTKKGGPQNSMMEEIAALHAVGLKIAILNLEAARFMSKTGKRLNDQIQELVNSGVVTQVFYDDPVTAQIMLLRYPPILQFPPNDPSRIEVGHLYIVANQAPSEIDGSDIRYLVGDCTRNAEFMFDTNVSWIPQGPQAREAIEPYLTSNELESFNSPGILEPAEWEKSSGKRSLKRKPVIGRHSRDDSMKWPASKDDLLSAYPIDDRVSVRIMGGGKTPLKVLGRSDSPANWEILARDEEPVVKFLHSLDFFVFFQHPNAVEAFGRSILEAIAANLVVILPKHYEEVFGPAAVYAEPAEVGRLVDEYWSDPELYDRQIQIARKHLESQFTREAFSNRILRLISKKAKSMGGSALTSRR
ncbi:glycosyltransferase [Corynebacterium sp. Marseille-P3884]|uniref:glycosyltransferase n=1 Tax=Corynebacterium sp. Marseille-P3884 TaxID=2495409 RepID=UPI001FF09DC3|nr:glycosyltransferase [Corynebacterium sp. Marseille-P3884]